MYEFIFREVARNSSRVQEDCNEWRCCQTVNVKQHKTVIRSICMAKTCSNQAASHPRGNVFLCVIFIFFCFKPIKSPDLAFLRLFTYMVQQPVTRGTLQYVRVTGQRPARLTEVKGNDIFWSNRETNRNGSCHFLFLSRIPLLSGRYWEEARKRTGFS